MRKLVLLVFAIAGAGLILAGVSLARGGDDDNGRIGTRLDGYQETPLTLSTKGKGTFEAQARLERDRVPGSPTVDSRAEPCCSPTSTSVGAPRAAG